MYRRLLSLAFAALLAMACDSTNPVEPPATPNPGGTSDAVTVTVTSGSSQIQAGSTAATPLTITARKGDGSPVADGTEVVVNTSLGYFSLDGTGKPVQLVKQTLSGGSTTVTFFPGKDVGTANILAQVGTSSGKLNLAVVEAAVPPVAEFAFEVSALSVLFQDMSTGTPTAWSWDFGDGDGTNRQNPLHTYAVEGTYTVSLTVTAAGGTSTKRKFVTVTAGDPLIADFSYTTNGRTVLFADASAGKPTSWHWDFGDGKTSTARNPSHAYSQTGTYTVTLSIANEFGVTDSTSQFVTLSAGEAPVAAFRWQADGLTVLFADASTGGKPKSWSWDFGDGKTSTEQNPSHKYGSAGTYRVTLTASNDAGSSSKTDFVTVSLGDAPKADFTFQVNGLNAVFTDTSTGKPMSWSWDFGDGSTSTAQNPSHAYKQGGTYTVTLTATNAGGSSSKAQFVTVANAPTANFNFQVNGLKVSFTDLSTGSPTAWSWTFGDGAVSTEQNPTHDYTQAGSYTVKLTASNTGGSGSATKVVTVNSAASRPTARFCYQRQGLTVIFTDISTQSPTTWLWDFGDCSTSPATCQSDQKDPTHTYTAAGTYAVTLTASNASGPGSKSIFLPVSASTTDASPVCGN